ncbi:MAG: metal-sensitive transcriptional regulator [Anaerolineae bacterium]|nr:metal-sensitive transcriptional regulator [Anaerolineae bacterium]
MNEKNKTDLLNRLKSVAGHLNGIIAMVEQDRYCIDVINQVQATQAALGKVNRLFLNDHMRTCVTTAIQGDDLTERERVLHELSDLFSATNR